MKISELLEAREYNDARHTLAMLNSVDGISIEKVAITIDNIVDNVTADKQQEAVALLYDIQGFIHSVYVNEDYWRVIGSIGHEEAMKLTTEWTELEDKVETYINKLK